ncbi:NAD(P)/FAD-dependent oxidoreductase [Martelella alba]|uniref:NAD(P)/FAD-dependent oxidoreductase n=1 Tax=Martelella alba TaxID=2590451 RepID=A0A506U734_9HYPH|nr:NAD(P)/FAD-dependent oxidoreductase [Martelella alba]
MGNEILNDQSKLSQLQARARHDLECTDYPAREWVEPREYQGQKVKDVVIIGGGQTGLTVAFKLMREKVTNIAVLERSEAGSEGPWCTFARMITLRTPKTVTGPELGIGSLSVRAWWEAKYGVESWDALGKIPKELWCEYLLWLRETVGIPVQNGVEVTDVEPLSDDLFAVTAKSAEGEKVLYARNIVLATGIDGSGHWSVPGIVSQNLPREAYGHTSEMIAFEALKGKKIAVIGAGASAFDNAAVALETGAASVKLFARRKRLPVVNPYRWMEYTGFLRHFGDLDDARKWRIMKTLFDRNQPPPADTYKRCADFANFSLKLGSPIDGLAYKDGKVLLTTPHGTEEFDYLIVGTGFVNDFASRPELTRFADKIAVWGDRYTPDAPMKDAVIAGFPYLSDCFQLTEKVPGTAPFLRHVFNYTYGAMPSLAGAAGISSLKFGIDRVSRGVTRELFLAEADDHFEALKAYDVPELVLPEDMMEELPAAKAS